MDRKTRKANLKRLQLAETTSSGDLRSTKTVSAGISGYFTTPTKTDALNGSSSIKDAKIPLPDNQLQNCKSPCDSPQACLENNIKVNNTEATIPKTAKRTKLNSFLYKDQKQTSRKTDDFEVPEQKPKRAPDSKTTRKATLTKTKSSRTRSKRQESIKSAFMRNEQIFSEITAQHCLADNFSPDDMQLALAMSKSVAETSGILCVPDEMEVVVDIGKHAADAQENIREKLRCYGFRTAPKEDYNTITAAFCPTNRRMKTKWAHKFTPLTLRDAAQQLKKVHQKVEELLSEQYTTKPLSDVELYQKPYLIHSSTLSRVKASQNEEVFRNAEHLKTESLENFYVKPLFEVSQVKAGHLLKDWSRIQGRDLTPMSKSQQNITAGRSTAETFLLAYKELQKFFTKDSSKDVNTVHVQDNAGVRLLHDDTDQNKKTVTENEIVHITANSTEQLEPFEENCITPTEINGKHCDRMMECVEKVTEKSLKLPGVISVKVNSNDTPQTDHKADDLNQSKKRSTKDAQNIESNNKTNRSAVVIDFSPLKGPPDKKSKIQSPYPPEKRKCPEVFTAKGLTRETSPDLFADSDSDVEGGFNTAAMLSPEKKSSNEDKLGVETFEIFSSDEVKTSSANKEPEAQLNENLSNDDCVTLVDLTQDDLSDGPSRKPPVVPNEDFDIFLSSSSNESIVVGIYNDLQVPAKSKEVLNCIDVNTVLHTKTTETTVPRSINFEVDPEARNEIGSAEKIKCLFNDNSLNFDQVLLEIKSAERTNSFLDLEGDKQKSTSFHFQTALQKDSYGAYAFNSDETNSSIFQKLESKYLNANNVTKNTTRKSVSMTQFDLSNIGRKRLSFTQFEHQIYNAAEGNVKVSRRSLDTPLIRRTKSSSISPNAEASIDLTQNCEESEEDECIMLSDDEINYSIWKADKTMHLTDDNEPQIYTQNLTLSSDSEDEKITSENQEGGDDSSGFENGRIMSGRREQDNNLYPSDLQECKTTLENLEVEHILSDSEDDKETEETVDQRKANSFVDFLGVQNDIDQNKKNSISSSLLTADFDSDHEPVQSEFLFSEADDLYLYNTAILSNDLSRARTEFGILDGYSQLPTTEIETPIKSYSKQLKSKSENLLNELSFLNSPSEKSAPMKRFGSATSSQLLDGYSERPTTDTETPLKSYSKQLKSKSENLLNEWSFLNSPSEKSAPMKRFGSATSSQLLDGYSERPTTDTETPLKSYSKQLKSKSENLLNELSFLNSPSEKSAPMKRFGSATSSQRFNTLLKQVQLEQQGLHTTSLSLEHFDEFDKLVFSSPKFKQQQQPSLKQPTPAGLEQLLTGEISFRMASSNEGDCFTTPKKIYVTPNKNRDKSKSKQELHVDGRTYEVRVTTSPKPDFSSQSDDELLKQLYNFGMKPLKRKQALLMLEYIYNQTHPILVNENDDKMGEHMREEEVEDAVDVMDAEEGLRTQLSVELQSLEPTTTDPLTASQQPAPTNKLNLCDCFGDVLLRHQHLSAELPDEQYTLQTNVSKKLPQALLPLHVAWFNLVCSSIALHEAILMYEPIDLQEIYLFFKSLGYRYDPKDLKSFFDRRCIIFRYDLGAPGKSGESSNRHVRKKKKKTCAKKLL